MIYALLPLSALKNKTNKEYTIIGNIKYKDLYRRFYGVDKLILLTERNILRFTYRALNNFARSYLEKLIECGKFISNDYEFYDKEYPFYDKESLYLYTRRVIYKVEGLPEILPEITYDIKGLSVPQNMVLISPYAKSVPLMPRYYFEKIAKSLVGKGYKVYTNCAGDEEVIDGTDPLKCSLEDLYGLAKEKEIKFIGLRSGICDLLALTDIKMYVLYNNYHLSNISSLKEYSKNIKEYYGDNYDDYVNDILQDFKEYEN